MEFIGSGERSGTCLSNWGREWTFLLGAHYLVRKEKENISTLDMTKEGSEVTRYVYLVEYSWIQPLIEEQGSGCCDELTSSSVRAGLRLSVPSCMHCWLLPSHSCVPLPEEALTQRFSSCPLAANNGTNEGIQRPGPMHSHFGTLWLFEAPVASASQLGFWLISLTLTDVL